MIAQPLVHAAACVFDAYGTLFDVASAARREGEALRDKAEPLAALWRTKQLEYSWLRSLMGRHADFAAVTAEALDFAMAALRIDDARLRARLLELYVALDAYDDAGPTLAALKRAGRVIAILSNGTPAMLAAAVQSAGLAGSVDAVLSVEEVGIFKPDRRVYALACRRLDLAPERICFVSSNGWDAAGAAAFGFQAVWANRTGAPRERLPAEPVAEIGSLRALPALLGL